MNPNTKAQHLLHRAAFGIPFGQPAEAQSIDSLFKNSTESKPLDLITLPEAENEMDKSDNRKLSVLKSREKLIQLNVAWLVRMTSAEAVLREKLTLFWHNHFACRTQIPYLAQQQNNTIREHALGKFGALLMAISKDAAMLQFLNNRQNRKDSPNENFAREVLELFTLGRGYYSEDDIKNAARAFTGWNFNVQTGEYVFRPKLHDNGVKTFRGKTGNFTGEDIIALTLDDKQTARHITEKIWHYFVSTELRDIEIIGALAKDFYENEYAIDRLLKSIFSSDWFYDTKFTGNRIKSPIELLAGIQTHTNGKFVNPLSAIFVQRTLSQMLFLPPNVGGWPSGREWIDSSSLTFRLALPSVLLKNKESHIQAKDDGDVNNVVNQINKPQKLEFKVDWTTKAQQFTRATALKTLENIEHYLMAASPTASNRKLITGIVTKNGSDEIEFVKNAFTAFMSLPEYQLS